MKTYFKTAAAIGAALALAIALAQPSTIAVAAGIVTKEGAKVAGEGAKFEDGKWVLPSGDPTYHIDAQGTLDFQTYRGFQRYHAECHVCHGPEGVGSTYAPALANSLKTMSYEDFVGVVASGRIVHQPGGGESVMPALGDNKNVMCYLDAIYNYLKARADDVVPRGRPKGRADLPPEVKAAEDACLGG
ncbi:MAG: c-type cytochrome, methanol metabolism-related [Hyphomicrobiaceae bacterium]|nr:c-type cytochrome, methanol metabolism-related [Hyphomicrobiaceae bacterium]